MSGFNDVVEDSAIPRRRFGQNPGRCAGPPYLGEYDAPWYDRGMPREHIHFVTGRLAEPSLRNVVERLSSAADFDFSVSVLGITVAALMTTEWVARRLKIPPDTTRVLLPGYCRGELALLESATGVPVERGPKDLRELPEYFGRASRDDYGAYDIEILAEINHASHAPLAEVLEHAARLRADGADVIDLGCTPGEVFHGVGEYVRTLREAGYRVSIDSYDPREIEPAVRSGAELVLSVNKTNREHAADWGCEVVAVPNAPSDLSSVEATLELLDKRGVAFRIDPILEPIGFGFAASLGRYLEVRRRWPEAEMMMGVGNLTELTDVDSAGLNVLLMGLCQELAIRSVLTTQVINWARSSVKECDLARRLAHYAVARHALPKHVEPRLVTLRDPRLVAHTDEELRRLASHIKDHNVRVFAEDDGLRLLSAGVYLRGDDAFALFEELQAQAAREIDASHAFYLGYELAKAVTARTLGKQYRQDEALDWGFLTQAETRRRDRSKPKADESET